MENTIFELRSFQREALAALEFGTGQPKHVICVAPTGSGKSLIYERLASKLMQKTVLITPLVALARQQFQKFQSLKIPTFLGAGGAKEMPGLTQSGAWIISPEVLQYDSKHTFLKKWAPQLMVVDECHCLWEWGDDFRPAFKSIPQVLNSKYIQQSLWLTATLPMAARSHLRSLFKNVPIEIGKFDLPQSLYLSLRQVPLSDRLSVLLGWLSQQSGPGIVFVATREATLRLSRVIASFGKRTLIYHGGMSVEERKNAEALVAKRVPDVIVATSAFGMGMDYDFLTFVILWQVPASILSLVQTIGRVGRGQGNLGRSLVLWDLDDFRMLEWMVRDSDKRRNELQDLLLFLTSKECRRVALRKYFDLIANTDVCGRCDFCLNE